MNYIQYISTMNKIKALRSKELMWIKKIMEHMIQGITLEAWKLTIEIH